MSLLFQSGGVSVLNWESLESGRTAYDLTIYDPSRHVRVKLETPGIRTPQQETSNTDEIYRFMGGWVTPIEFVFARDGSNGRLEIGDDNSKTSFEYADPANIQKMQELRQELELQAERTRAAYPPRRNGANQQNQQPVPTNEIVGGKRRKSRKTRRNRR